MVNLVHFIDYLINSVFLLHHVKEIPGSIHKMRLNYAQIAKLFAKVIKIKLWRLDNFKLFG